MSLESLVFTLAQLSAVLVAWVATYLVHSTLILGGAWIISRFVKAHHTRDTLWKAAILGALATATMQRFSVIEPVGGAHDASVVIERKVWEDAPVSRPVPGTEAGIYPARLMEVSEAVRLIPLSIVVLWAIYAALVLVRVLFATRRARAALGPRDIVIDSTVAERFRNVAARFGIKRTITLTVSGEMNSPVALGQTEICVPSRLVSELSPDEQESVLAHEIAHVVRRDPLWLLASVTIESILFFQPLNRLARLRIQEEAEFLADDLAVEKASSGLVLARCLARVAEWMSAPERRLLAPAFVEQKASLTTRIKRLLDPSLENSRIAHDPLPPRLVLALLLPAVVLVVAPGFTAGGKRPWGTAAFHWEGTVAPGASVEIKGLMGNVRAEPWEGSTVVVNATRHGRATVPDVRFAVVRHPSGVTICTVYPVPAGVEPNTCEPGESGRANNTRANDVEIEYIVRVPRGVGFAARTATGDISTGRLTAPVAAVSSSGEIDVATESYAEAATASGNIDVKMGAAGWSGTLRIASSAGNIRVALPPKATATIRASSKLGRVRSEFPLGGEQPGFLSRIKPRGSFGNTLSGVIGGELSSGVERTLDLRSVTGKIDINVSKESQ
jgi:beta-lactamase regulating signal transducer with metallopeptidase domain